MAFNALTTAENRDEKRQVASRMINVTIFV